MGLGLTAGYKFKRSPNFYMQRMRFSHIMRGAYIKPTLWLNFFNYDLTDYDHPPDPVTFQYPVTRESATAFSGMLEFGNQLVFSDLFLVDYFAGIGYGYTTNQSEYNYSNYGFWGGAGTWSYSSPVTFNFGLKVGYLMK
jgi:hypothetical protein